MSFDLLRKFRSLATLSVLGVLLLVGVTWGWSAATAPLPTTEDPPICDDTTVAAGDKVYPDQVTVSVLNAGDRDGLAGQTMERWSTKGFLQGETANARAKAKVTGAEIWTDDPESAAVRLVATYLAKNGKGVAIKEEETDRPRRQRGRRRRVPGTVIKGRKSVAGEATRRAPSASRRAVDD